ncbi:MAG: arsenical-resistance protein, partial [Thermodesulfobacteriota bacterium]
AGFITRTQLIKRKGLDWYESVFLRYTGQVSVTALLLTLVFLFMLQGHVIVERPLVILMIAIPLFIQTMFIFILGYWASKVLGLAYEDAAPTSMIGASNHFEVAIATAATLFGLGSGAALATVVGVLIEVPVMLMLVRICLRTRGWFPSKPRPGAATLAREQA